MATVTGYTAEKMDEIVAATIVGATIDGDGHLILERADGTPVDAGSAIGPEGDPGAGFPAGGAIGMVLKKNTGADYDTTWSLPIPVGTVAPSTPVAGQLWVDTA